MNHFSLIAVACVVVGFAPLAAGAQQYYDYGFHDIRVVSGGGSDHAKLIAHNLHRVDAAMSAVLGAHQADWRPKTTVYVVPAKVYALIRGVEDNSASSGIPGAFDNTILMNRDANFDNVLFGAYAGYVSSLMSGGYSFRWPIWFIKGLSEVMGTAKVDGTRVTIGGFESDRVRTLGSSTWIPAKALFEIEGGDPQMRNLEFARLYEAECWFFVHQIIVENQQRKSFFDYFSRLDDGESQDQAFAESFGVDYAEIDKMMHAAIDSRKLTLIKVSVGDEPDPTEATALNNARVNGLFARAAVEHGAKTANAAEFAKQSLSMDANDEDALYALARVALGGHDFPQALTYADQLCRHDSPSRSSEPTCGMLFSQLATHARESADPVTEAKTLTARAATYLQSAIDHDPEDLASWSELSELLMKSNDKERSAVLLPGVKHAWAQHMDSEPLARDAAGLCSVTGDYDCAYKFALVWRKHALNPTSRANAEIYAERMKSVSERQSLTAPPASHASTDSPSSSATKLP